MQWPPPFKSNQNGVILVSSIKLNPHQMLLIVKRDFGSVTMNWDGKPINSLDTLILKTWTTLSRLPVKWERKCQRSILGNSTTNHSHSQELEDTTPLLTTWICSSISKITLTLTFPIESIKKTSLEPPRLLLLTSVRNITMVSGTAQPTTTQELRKLHTEELSADSRTIVYQLKNRYYRNK